jgi:sialate O-acetylesterase
MHEQWQNKRGLAFFFRDIECPGRMHAEFRMGYDGPFRLWIDGRSFFVDMKGSNPCLQDKACKAVWLGKGRHRVVIGMDLANGNAWGFFLRMERLDLAKRQKRDGDYPLPAV